MSALISSVSTDAHFHEPMQGQRATAMTESAASLSDDRHREFQRLARLTGLLFLITYAASIPPVLTFYVPALSDPAFVLGEGLDRGISWGALLEMILIFANVASALTLYPVLRRAFPVLSLGYVAARITENAFIGVGIIAMLALNTLRLNGAAADEAALLTAGQSLVAVHDWTFRLGPGVVVGAGNGLILGYMMWKTQLVPRALSILGLVGGPAILIAGALMIFGTIEIGSTPQVIATIPEFFWELFFGLYLVIRGFNPAAVEALARR
jgi:Domain of unknown function (DUF4386)